jgi:hypothetical protein
MKFYEKKIYKTAVRNPQDVTTLHINPINANFKKGRVGIF